MSHSTECCIIFVASILLLFSFSTGVSSQQHIPLTWNLLGDSYSSNDMCCANSTICCDPGLKCCNLTFSITKCCPETGTCCNSDDSEGRICCGGCGYCKRLQTCDTNGCSEYKSFVNSTYIVTLVVCFIAVFIFTCIVNPVLCYATRKANATKYRQLFFLVVGVQAETLALHQVLVIWMFILHIISLFLLLKTQQPDYEFPYGYQQNSLLYIQLGSGLSFIVSLVNYMVQLQNTLATINCIFKLSGLLCGVQLFAGVLHIVSGAIYWWAVPSIASFIALPLIVVTLMVSCLSAPAAIAIDRNKLIINNMFLYDWEIDLVEHENVCYFQPVKRVTTSSTTYETSTTITHENTTTTTTFGDSIVTWTSMLYLIRCNCLDIFLIILRCMVMILLLLVHWGVSNDLARRF